MRDEQLQLFLDRLNPPRIRKGFPPYTIGRLVKMLADAGYETGDLHRLYKECLGADNFGMLFHHKIRIRAAAQLPVDGQETVS